MRSLRLPDALTCVAVFGFTVWYCATAPYNLYVYDEGIYLYESKRVLNGDIYVRDFFDLVMPFASYVMAGAYWLFGASMTTARTTMAVVHGLIAMGMVVACRWMGVRTAIAALAGLSESAICYMAMERAAPHWIGTLFCVAILLVLLRRPLTRRRDVFVVGVLVGGLSITQQQRGVALSWVPLVVLVLDHWWLASQASRAWRPLIAHGCLYAAGVSVVVIPTMLALIALAGFAAVWVAVVQYPLVNYRHVVPIEWGSHNPIQDPYIGPVFKYLSLAIPLLAALRCGVLARAHAPLFRPLLVAIVASVGTLLSIAYVSGYAYIVLAGPVWFTLIADLLETGVRRAERRSPRGWIVATAASVSLALFLAGRLAYRRAELKAAWPYEGDTPFGRMNFSYEAEGRVMNAVRELVGPTRELFVYPTGPGFYLLTGTDNITRFQIAIPGYTSPEHMREVIDTLERRRQPYVIRNWMWTDNEADPIRTYLLERYEKVPLPFPPKQFPAFKLFRRKPDGVEPTAP